MEDRKYKILIAEDNPINVKVALFTLKNIASEIHIAENGEKALEKYSTNNYDVILMDVKMPVMDGYQATRKIREMEKENGFIKQIPIIAITANNQVEEIEECLSIGMNGFLSKPFTALDAVNVIKSVVE